MKKDVLPGLVLGVLVALPASAQSQVWTLESAARHVMDVAPESRIADAEVEARQGELSRAGAWPNPSVSLRVDDKLGLESGDGGQDLTEISVSQPIPMTRLSRQKAVAEANLEAARDDRRYRQLQLERQAAYRFHALQLASAHLELAEQRVAWAERYLARQKRTDGGVVRYLTPAETKRLQVVLETANQAAIRAEGKYNEALSAFRLLLGLPEQAEVNVPKLNSVSFSRRLAELDQLQQQHAALSAGEKNLQSARAGLDLERSRYLADPTVSVFQGQEYIGGERQSVSGLMLNVEVPLWNRNGGGIAKAQADITRARSRLELVQRDLSSHLHQSYRHLNHLIEQAERYRRHLLEPARQVFELTRKSFNAGETGILDLIDANDTYFGARAHYLELLQQSWQELAELRLAAGMSLIESTTANGGKGGRS